jgi:hypothetical protein
MLTPGRLPASDVPANASRLNMIDVKKAASERAFHSAVASERLAVGG